MRCRGLGLVAAAGLALGSAVLGCAKTKDVVATQTPLGADAATNDASGSGKRSDAGDGALGDAGTTCQQCQQIGYKFLFFSSIAQNDCRVPEDKSLQQALFMFLDDNLGPPPQSGESRMSDRCDGNPAGYLHDFQDASGHFLCPWYCTGARMWMDRYASRISTCAPCFTIGMRP